MKNALGKKITEKMYTENAALKKKFPTNIFMQQTSIGIWVFFGPPPSQA